MNDRGSVTIWLLGLCVCLLFLGGLSVDLWRVMNVRRELVSLADSAAVQGATAIDEGAFRLRRRVDLDPDRAEQAAWLYLRRRLPEAARARVTVSTDAVEVRAEQRVRLSLLGVLLPEERLLVRVRAEVRPARRP